MMVIRLSRVRRSPKNLLKDEGSQQAGQRDYDHVYNDACEIVVFERGESSSLRSDLFCTGIANSQMYAVRA